MAFTVHSPYLKANQVLVDKSCVLIISFDLHCDISGGKDSHFDQAKV